MEQQSHHASAGDVLHDDVRLTDGEAEDYVDDNSSHAPSNTAFSGHASRGYPAPTLKRRRVARACTRCRLSKVKCSGEQPCLHCVIYSNEECTYNQPSQRRRNYSPQYTQTLEGQVKRATVLLRMLLRMVYPLADLSDPNLELKFRSHLQSLPPSPHRSGIDVTSPATATVLAHEDGPSPYVEESLDDKLESMVKSTGQLDLDDQGNVVYHGHSSGLSFVRRVRESLGYVLGPDTRGTPFVHVPSQIGSTLAPPNSATFSGDASANSPWETTSNMVGYDSPTLETAHRLSNLAINRTAVLLKCVHFPSYAAQFQSLYELGPENYGNEENKFLPLVYAVLAVGVLYESGAKEGYQSAISEGFKYFRQCRSLMNIVDIRDLRQLQAVIYMVLFLQSSSKLSVCYAYIGICLRSALRMGLHRCFNENFTLVESQVRKQVFWTIQRLDTFVGALLGLPHSIEADQIDQELPAELDDEYLTDSASLPMPEGCISVIAASNAHTKLLFILTKIVKHIYPVCADFTKDQQGNAVKSYSVSYSKITEIENDLQLWQDALPIQLKPGSEGSDTIIRCQHLLRMAFSHTQMMLYRPFLHHSARKTTAQVHQHSYRGALQCLLTSRNIILIVISMRRRGLLNGAYWFSMYATFFAILSLVYFALENPTSPASSGLLDIAKQGREALTSMASKSLAADRCVKTLEPLFEQLDTLDRNSSTEVLLQSTDHSPSPFDVPQLKSPTLASQTSLCASDSPHPPANLLLDFQQYNLNLTYSPAPSSLSSNVHQPSHISRTDLIDRLLLRTPDDPFAYPNSQETNVATVTQQQATGNQQHGGLQPYFNHSPYQQPFQPNPSALGNNLDATLQQPQPLNSVGLMPNVYSFPINNNNNPSFNPALSYESLNADLSQSMLVNPTHQPPLNMQDTTSSQPPQFFQYQPPEPALPTSSKQARLPNFQHQQQQTPALSHDLRSSMHAPLSNGGSNPFTVASLGPSSTPPHATTIATDGDGGVANVSFSTLLGGEEWAGLPQTTSLAPFGWR